MQPSRVVVSVNAQRIMIIHTHPEYAAVLASFILLLFYCQAT